MSYQDYQKTNLTDIDQKILLLLEQKPGIKAREIATYLNTDKKIINGALYGVISDHCVQDEKYCWYLRKDAPIEKRDDKRSVVPKTALSNLVRYFLSCLGQEDQGGISVYADSKYDLDYVELDSLLNSDNSNFNRSSGIQNLISKAKKDRGRIEIYFAYPTTLKRVKSKKSSWEGMIVEPIILFPVELENGVIKLSLGFPIFNLSVLKRFTGAEQEQLMDELVQLEEELNLNSEDEMPELDDLIKKLYAIRREWPWKEEINPDDLNTNPPLRSISVDGIYNRAILIIGERSPFTQGLESELKALSEVSPDLYERTALGQWLSGNFSKNVHSENLPLLEVLSLNSEQRQAIQNSLANPLTIITGPPGTGKSQVVTNLLINAAWQGKKVLFASKNNKAVDVVEIRVNNLGSRPVLLRMGSGQYQTKLAQYLMGLLGDAASENDEIEFEQNRRRYKEFEIRFSQLNHEEKELIRLRNETDELDQSFEKIRNEIPQQIIENLKKINRHNFETEIYEFKDAVKRADKNSQGFFTGLLWVFVKKKRLMKLQQAIEDLKPLASAMEWDLPKMDFNEEWPIEVEKIEKKLDLYLYYILTIQEYFSSLELLKKAKSIEVISVEKINLMKRMYSEAQSLWRGWLRLQPNRLSQSDRKLLSSYTALLKMVIDAGGDLYSKTGGKIYQQYTNLSKQVSHLLPAWAITSLSARGRIPFEPGFFDIIVFDEASQCDIASALPLLYRAKQAVIIGDPKQLSHISALQKGQDQQFLEKFNLIPDYAQWAYSYNSLYDLASGLISKNDVINLRDHHRSHSDIIEFSNQEFYEGNLRVATNYDSLKFLESNKSGIRWINVVGKVKRPSLGGAENEIEANNVVNEIKKLIYERNYTGSIGVVTPFRAQANLIRQLVSAITDLQAKLMNHDFLVDTVHKFQGDERDLMIFSPVVSINMPEGALGFMKNNGNLFNVAITRARAMLLVVGDQNAIINCRVSYLENFAKYAKKLESDRGKKITHTIKDLGQDYPTVSYPERVSEWEHILYKAMYKSGIKAIPQYQVEKYTLDFALFKGGRQLNIEVDGERYHKNWTGELCRRDQIRNQRLFELGWDVKRFWVYEVRDDIDECILRIKNWLEN